MQFKRLRDVLLVLISVIILMLLFIRTQSIDNTQHNRYNQDLRQLSELDAILNQNILKSRFELLTYYDPLVSEITELNEVRRRLEQIPSFIDQAGHDELGQLLEEYDQILKNQESLIEVFKSENSILKNSLRYFPFAITELADNTAKIEGETQLVMDLNRFLQDILVYNLIANEELPAKIEEHIKKLDENQQAISVSSDNSEIDIASVINHARIILERKPRMDALISEIIALPTEEKSSELFNAYNRHYQQAAQSNNFYRLCLYFFSLFLITYLAIYLINRFRASTNALQRAKEALQESLISTQQAEEQYRSIFENATEGIYQSTVDPLGKYLSINPALFRLYGYNSTEDLLENVNNLQQQLYVDPDRRTTFIRMMEEQGSVSSFESQVYCKSGEVIWVSENVRAVYDENGDLLHYEGVVQDITERKKAQQLLAEYNRKLLQEVEERTKQLAKANAEIKELNERLQIENVRLGAELDVTRQLQQILLPTVAELKQIKGLEVSAFVEAIDISDEELYDLLLQHTQIKIGLGGANNDQSNGVLILMTRSVVRALLTSDEQEQTNFLSMLNRTIDDKIHYAPMGENMSLALLNYHTDERVRSNIEYERIIMISQGGTATIVDTYDLGFQSLEDEQHIPFVQLEVIEGIIFYTGDISKTENADGEPYALEQLLNVISENWHESAEDIMLAAVEDIYDHIGEPRQLDQLTLVILKQKDIIPIKGIVLHNESTREIVLKA